MIRGLYVLEDLLNVILTNRSVSTAQCKYVGLKSEMLFMQNVGSHLQHWVSARLLSSLSSS